MRTGSGLAVISLLWSAGAGATTAGYVKPATLAPDGAWTWFNDPRALFHNGALYFGFVRKDGASTLNVFNADGGKTVTLWTSTWREYDDHDNPAILRLQDGRLLAVYARHGSAQTFNYRLSSSTNPVTPADWGKEQTIPATGAGVTYSNPHQLAAEAGKVFNFTRNLNFNPTFTTSTDSGAHWSEPRLLIRTGAGRIRPYVKFCSDSIGRIDLLYTDGHPLGVTNSLYHAFYERGALRRTDGSFLKGLEAIPVLHDAGERGSLIYPYSEAPAADFSDHIPAGRAWCWEIVYQTNGWPACVFSVQRDNVASDDWSGDRIYYFYARWTGTNWQRRFIAHAGRPLYVAERDYAGGIAIDPENASVVYISTDAARPFDLSTISSVPTGARYELYRGVTTNGGIDFSWRALTANSSLDNLRPYVPRHRRGKPALLWLRGNYSSYTSFDTAVVGLLE